MFRCVVWIAWGGYLRVVLLACLLVLGRVCDCLVWLLVDFWLILLVGGGWCDTLWFD